MWVRVAWDGEGGEFGPWPALVLSSDGDVLEVLAFPTAATPREAGGAARVNTWEADMAQTQAVRIAGVSTTATTGAWRVVT